MSIFAFAERLATSATIGMMVTATANCQRSQTLTYIFFGGCVFFIRCVYISFSASLFCIVEPRRRFCVFETCLGSSKDFFWCWNAQTIFDLASSLIGRLSQKQFGFNGNFNGKMTKKIKWPKITFPGSKMVPKVSKWGF